MYIDRIKTTNLKPEIRARVIPYIQRLSRQNYIDGIVLLGGLANTTNRNFMDKFSDVDMSIFIRGTYDKFDAFDHLPDFEFHIPFGNDMLEINVHQQFTDNEWASEWDESKKEAYTYTSEILCDCHGKIAELIAIKTKYDDVYRQKRLSIILSQYYWLVNINPLRQVERGYSLNGIDLLNTGIDLLIEGVFLYNRRYRPHPKWRIEVLLDLPWLPDNMRELLEESFITENIDKKTILHRREKLIKMFMQLEIKAIDDNLFEQWSPYDFACRYAYLDRQVSKYSRVDRLLSHLEQLDTMERTLFNGLANEYFISNIHELTIQKDMPDEYVQLIEKLKRQIISAKQVA